MNQQACPLPEQRAPGAAPGASTLTMPLSVTPLTQTGGARIPSYLEGDVEVRKVCVHIATGECRARNRMKTDQIGGM